jgi:hypothetical protein
MEQRKETKKRRKEQNKKRGREQTNHTESFKSMFI